MIFFISTICFLLPRVNKSLCIFEIDSLSARLSMCTKFLIGRACPVLLNLTVHIFSRLDAVLCDNNIVVIRIVLTFNFMIVDVLHIFSSPVSMLNPLLSNDFYIMTV